MAIHPATAKVLSYFEYEHLPEGPLRDTSKKFYDFAHDLAASLPPVAKTTDALNELLRAKDDAVRAALDLVVG